MRSKKNNTYGVINTPTLSGESRWPAGLLEGVAGDDRWRLPEAASRAGPTSPAEPEVRADQRSASASAGAVGAGAFEVS